LTAGQTEIRTDSGFFADCLQVQICDENKARNKPGKRGLFDPRIASNFTPGNCDSALGRGEPSMI
jgi:hypothetical protein